MLSSNSKSHETFFGNWTNQITGNINKYYAQWTYYFNLKQTNEKLAAENVALRNQLAQNFVGFDTTKKLGTLILRKDSLEKIRNTPAYLDSIDRRRNKMNINNLFLLGQIYKLSNEKSQMIETLNRIRSLNPTSEVTKQAEQVLKF